MGVSIHVVHQRLAELYIKYKSKEGLTPAEQKELDHCMAKNASLCWEAAALYNYSLMASQTSDVDWQHEICRDIDNQK